MRGKSWELGRQWVPLESLSEDIFLMKKSLSPILNGCNLTMVLSLSLERLSVRFWDGL